MKHTMLLALLVILSISTAFGLADGAGNGGGAWVCSNKDQSESVRWIKLVDLYEAENEFGLTLAKFDNLAEDKIIEAVLNGFMSADENLYKEILPYFEEIKSKIKEVDDDLEIISDALYRIRPPKKSCLDGTIKYVQIANYTTYGPILVSSAIVGDPMFREVDKAALIVHETVYSFLRNRYSDTDSVRARKFVGFLFSNLSDGIKKDEIGKIMGRTNNKYFEMEFVKIPAGTFVMGASENELKEYKEKYGYAGEENPRTVTLTKDYEMMTTEVTQQMYFEIMGWNPSKRKSIEYCPESFEIRESPNYHQKVSICPNYPVTNVSYENATKFAIALSLKTGRTLRLPTEAEWEYAARAGSNSAYFFGDNPEFLDEYAIYPGNTDSRSRCVQLVGPLRDYANKPNRFGLYDMYGNVSEWVSDWWSRPAEEPNNLVDWISSWWAESPKTEDVDPVGPETGDRRIIRGGDAWSDPIEMRSAARSWHGSGGGADFFLGFRLVRTLN